MQAELTYIAILWTTIPVWFCKMINIMIMIFIPFDINVPNNLLHKNEILDIVESAALIYVDI